MQGRTGAVAVVEGNYQTMPVRRPTLIYRLLLTAALVVTTYLSTTSRHIPGVEDLNDKLNHVLAFYALGLFADFSWPESAFRARKVFSLLGYGLAIEIVQYFIPERSCSLFDLGADAVGLLLYSVSVPLLKHMYPLSERFRAGDGRNTGGME
jgi:VanZ family protein